MSNSWRSPASGAKIFQAWARLFGKDRALKVAGRLPPKVLKGRFGAIHKVEDFYKRAGKRETEAVYREVFIPQVKAAAKPRVDALVEDDEGEDFTIKR